MLAAGSRLGPYTILAPLGAGGMGEVYRARDPRLGREVAVKVLPAAVSGDGDRLRRFEQEARAASALNHPNILTVFDTGSQDGIVYLVTELLEGETLRERLAGGALPARKAVEIAIQVARGLAAAHERRIVHRDLKPENLFLTRDGRVKILDFGLAKLQPQQDIAEAATVLTGTEPGVVLGTAGYMAPEQVRGQPADHRADLFALGAVLYEMLTGRRAFHKESAAETMAAILREEPPDLAESGRGVPLALDRVVRHCLEKDPHHRFQSASDLAFDLESISVLSGTGVSPTLTKRRRSLRAAAGAGLLLAAVFLAGALAHRQWGRSGMPRFQRLTFRLGNVTNARFAPDGRTIVYSASWDNRLMELFSTRTDSPESRSFGWPPGVLHSISPQGEMLISLLRVQDGAFVGHTLARVPLAGGAPRPVLDALYPHWIDWAPGGETFADLHAGDYGARIEYPRGKGIWSSEGYAWDLRVAPGGDALAFCEDRGDLQQAVVMLDRSGRALARSGGWSQVPFLEWLRRGCVAWTPDGREVWFTGARPGEESGLYALTRGGEVRPLLRLPDDLALFDIAPDGRVLLAQVSRRSKLVARAPGEAQERTLSWFESSELADLSADGRRVLFTETGKGGGERMAVYIRRTDGSPAVRLGDGRALALSPDGRWALARSAADPRRLSLLPTGAGEPRALPPVPLAVLAARWLPGGRSVLIGGTAPGKGFQLCAMDVDAWEARLISGSGSETFVPSPDGSRVGMWTSDGVKIYPLAGGAPQSMPAGVRINEIPIQWRQDGRALYLARFNEVGRWIDEVDLATGRRRHWKELRAAGPSSAILNFLITPDGQAYAYDERSVLSTLYLIEGLL